MKELKKYAEDVAGCPIRSVLAVLSAKCPLLAMFTLSSGEPKHFGELGREIPDISPKMLSQTLKTLVGEDLISRRVLPEVPPRTQYCLTPYGKTFLDAANPLLQWGLSHLDRENSGQK